MKIKLFIIISYILIFFNSISLSKADNSELKIGLLAPLSGDHKELGNSLLYSLQLALNEIDDKYVHIIPRDSGSNDEKKLDKAIKEIKSQGANIIIGPLDNKDFDKIKKFSDMIFISPSNINVEFLNNIISIGVSFESQILALDKFLQHCLLVQFLLHS